jgi:hypothetical protein
VPEVKSWPVVGFDTLVAQAKGGSALGRGQVSLKEVILDVFAINRMLCGAAGDCAIAALLRDVNVACRRRETGACLRLHPLDCSALQVIFSCL